MVFMTVCFLVLGIGFSRGIWCRAKLKKRAVVAKMPDTFLFRIRRFREQETAGGAAKQEKFITRGIN